MTKSYNELSCFLDLDIFRDTLFKEKHHGISEPSLGLAKSHQSLDMNGLQWSFECEMFLLFLFIITILLPNILFYLFFTIMK